MKLKMPILRAVCGAAAAAVMSAMILTSCAGMPEEPEFPSSSGSSFASSSTSSSSSTASSSSAASSSSTAASSAPANSSQPAASSSSQPASSAASSAASSSGMNEENSPSSSTASSSSAGSSSGTVSIAAYQQEVLRLVNIERQKAGVAPLTMDNTALTAAAMKRAEEMQKVTDHIRPDGSSCFTILKEYKVQWTHICGENIAWMQTTPAQVVDSWMNSPGHRANILYPDFKQIGIGCVKRTDRGYNWVQVFIG